MFDSHCNTICCYTIFASLNAWNKAVKNIVDQFWIFAERTVSTLPSRIRYDVCHVHISFFHSGCIPFFTDAFCKIIDQVKAASFYGSGNSHCSRPCGKYTSGIVHTEDDLSVFVSRVWYHENRNRMCLAFSKCIQFVHPVCQFVRFWIFAQDKVSDSHIFYCIRGSVIFFGVKDRSVFFNYFFIKKSGCIDCLFVFLVSSHF